MLTLHFHNDYADGTFFWCQEHEHLALCHNGIEIIAKRKLGDRFTLRLSKEPKPGFRKLLFRTDCRVSNGRSSVILAFDEQRFLIEYLGGTNKYFWIQIRSTKE